MRTLARFEFALGRRVAWGSDGHQIHVAPHAFADANAFYSREDEGLFFGYFTGRDGKPVFTCLSHDVVAHETTHALLDGLRRRYIEPSSPDQAAFHEGFADVVALLSVFSLPDVVEAPARPAERGRTQADRTSEAADARRRSRKSVLLGLAEEMGQELSRRPRRAPCAARSSSRPASTTCRRCRSSWSRTPRRDPGRRDDERLPRHLAASGSKIGYDRRRQEGSQLVVEEGARAADHLLTMAIRAHRLLPADRHRLLRLPVRAADRRPRGRARRRRSTAIARRCSRTSRDYGIQPAADADDDGTWRRCDAELVYGRTHFDSMLRDQDEVFRFLWENRDDARDRRGRLCRGAVGPALHAHRPGRLRAARDRRRVHPDPHAGRPSELKAALGLNPPTDMLRPLAPRPDLRRRHPDLRRVRAAQVPDRQPTRRYRERQTGAARATCGRPASSTSRPSAGAESHRTSPQLHLCSRDDVTEIAMAKAPKRVDDPHLPGRLRRLLPAELRLRRRRRNSTC